VSNEIQTRSVGTDDTIPPTGKTAAIARDLRAQHVKRGPISRGQDHAVEWLLAAVDKAHSVAGKFRRPGSQSNAPALHAVHQVKSDQRDG